MVAAVGTEGVLTGTRVRGVGEGEGELDVGLERSITIGEVRGTGAVLRLRGVVGGEVSDCGVSGCVLIKVVALKGGGGGLEAGGMFGRRSCRLAKDWMRFADALAERLASGLACKLAEGLMLLLLRDRGVTAVSGSEST